MSCFDAEWDDIKRNVYESFVDRVKTHKLKFLNDLPPEYVLEIVRGRIKTYGLPDETTWPFHQDAIDKYLEKVPGITPRSFITTLDECYERCRPLESDQWVVSIDPFETSGPPLNLLGPFKEEWERQIDIRREVEENFLDEEFQNPTPVAFYNKIKGFFEKMINYNIGFQEININSLLEPQTQNNLNRVFAIQATQNSNPFVVFVGCTHRYNQRSITKFISEFNDEFRSRFTQLPGNVACPVFKVLVTIREIAIQGSHRDKMIAQINSGKLRCINMSDSIEDMCAIYALNRFDLQALDGMITIDDEKHPVQDFPQLLSDSGVLQEVSLVRKIIYDWSVNLNPATANQ